MGKKVVGIIFVCVVILVAIAIAVIASVATKSTKEEEVPSKEEPSKEEPSKEEPNKEALVEGEEEDFFCCRDGTTKLPRSKVEIFKKYSCFENLQRYKISNSNMFPQPHKSIQRKLYHC